MQLFRYEELDHNNVLDELNELKRERETDKEALENYYQTKERIIALKRAEIKLADYCEQLKKDLDIATFEDKRDILDMLAIKVIATPESIKIQGVIPVDLTTTQSSDEQPNLLTIGQTSA